MDLYDEFGNYTGPSLDDEEDFDDDDEEHSNYAPDDYDENNGALVEGMVILISNLYISKVIFFTTKGHMDIEDQNVLENRYVWTASVKIMHQKILNFTS